MLHPLSIVYDMERIDPLLSSVRCFDSLFVIILLWLFVANVPSINN